MKLEIFIVSKEKETTLVRLQLTCYWTAVGCRHEDIVNLQNTLFVIDSLGRRRRPIIFRGLEEV